jgi:Cu+-exporting ATPase
VPYALGAVVDRIAAEGGTPLAVARNSQVLGVVHLKDTVKEGMRERFEHLRAMGIRTVMVTGDNPRTAAKIAQEAGVDEFLAEATPEAKLELIRRHQADGRLVAMTGDGTNDAPALAQADVGIAIGTGTDVAVEAADVALMRGDLAGVAHAIALSRRTMRTMRQNLFWAFAYNIVMVPVAVAGLLDPAWAAAAMALSSVTVVLNALRLRGYRGMPTPAP